MALEPQPAQTTEQPKAPTPLVIPADPPEFQDEEIDVPLEEGETPPAAAETEAPKPREPKRRGPKRYAALTHERDEARGYAANLEAELQRERTRAAEAEERANKADKVAMQSFAAKAASDLEKAEAAHQAAIESGDAASITKATKTLSEASQTMQDVNAYNETAKAAPAPTPTPTPAPQAQPKQFQDPFAPHVRDWAMKPENRYWDKNARDDAGNVVLDRGGRPLPNPDFDEEMHVEATMYATLLESQIRKGKHSYKVGSPEYFRAIEDHIDERFKDEDDEDDTPPLAPAAPRRPSPVAGPSRAAPPASTPAANKVKLTSDQLRFIQKQVDNGGGPKYPSGHPKAHKPMTFEDAKVSFARRLQTQAKEQGT